MSLNKLLKACKKVTQGVAILYKGSLHTGFRIVTVAIMLIESYHLSIPLVLHNSEVRLNFSIHR